MPRQQQQPHQSISSSKRAASLFSGCLWLSQLVPSCGDQRRTPGCRGGTSAAPPRCCLARRGVWLTPARSPMRSVHPAQGRTKVAEHAHTIARAMDTAAGDFFLSRAAGGMLECVHSSVNDEVSLQPVSTAAASHNRRTIDIACIVFVWGGRWVGQSDGQTWKWRRGKLHTARAIRGSGWKLGK